MNFFLDENFPKSAVKLLSERDHTVFDIRSTAKEGATDDPIFKMAQDSQSIFLTTDVQSYPFQREELFCYGKIGFHLLLQPFIAQPIRTK